MHQDFEYRGYLVWHDGNETVCEEIGNEDEPLFQIGARSVSQAITMINQMHDALETGVSPIWFKDWMSQDIDPALPVVKRARETALQKSQLMCSCRTGAFESEADARPQSTRQSH